MVFLSPIPGTRNKKNIAFTEFGRDFAEKTVGILRMAELDALAELSPEERELYIRLNEKYNCRLIEKLYRIMDEDLQPLHPEPHCQLPAPWPL